MAIAIDDFGTGYSNRRSLQRLSSTVMKLEHSFITDLPRSKATRRLVAAVVVVTRAGALGLRLIAEGIETVEQREILRPMGCRFGQGYLFNRPVPLDQARRLLDAQPGGALAA